MKNRYFFLRHGENIHQREKQGIVYCWPDDNPPCALIEEGREQAKKAGETLKNKQIDLVFCSDILRCKETAELAGFKPIYDERLRDLNWGIFGGKTKEEYWNFYNNDRMKAFETPTPNGESWNQCKERAKDFLNEIENKYQNKNILIISHGDPMWLLEGYIKNIDNETLLNKRQEMMLKYGEVREII